MPAKRSGALPRSAGLGHWTARPMSAHRTTGRSTAIRNRRGGAPDRLLRLSLRRAAGVPRRVAFSGRSHAPVDYGYQGPARSAGSVGGMGHRLLTEVVMDAAPSGAGPVPRPP